MSIGLLLAAIVSNAFLVRGLFVPSRVASGSMAPTLLGPRIETACKRCGAPLVCGADQLPSDGRLRCDHCGFAENDASRLPILPGERLIIDRTAFAFRRPRRWEVVVFRCPEEGGEPCVKRVVGRPGETIELRSGDVYVNGQIVEPPAVLRKIARHPAEQGHPKWLLGPDEYFMLGDNRSESADSRVWPHAGIGEELLIGKPIAHW